MAPSRRSPGRKLPSIEKTICTLKRFAFQGELLKLGFEISERTISRWARRTPQNPEPARRWQAFLENHREAIAAMDFFTVPTITLGVLYCFFVIAHDRRRILHCVRRLLRNSDCAGIICGMRTVVSSVGLLGILVSVASIIAALGTLALIKIIFPYVLLKTRNH